MAVKKTKATNKKIIKKASKPKRPVILLAEDNAMISLAYQNDFRQAGFEVIPAFDGEEALEKIREKNPDLIFLDVIMPFMSGFDVLEKLKAAKNFSIPVIMLSNMGERQEMVRADR